MTRISKNTTKILFICMGNICRSPSAEAVMQSIVKQQGLEQEIVCDSAGTFDYHRGKPADARMQKHARLRGYELISISRPFEDEDFELFDWIITMDEDNYQQIKWLDQSNNYTDKIRHMTDFAALLKFLMYLILIMEEIMVLKMCWIFSKILVKVCWNLSRIKNHEC